MLVLSSGPSVVCGLLLWWPLWSAWPLLVPMGGMLAPMATEPSPHFPLCGALVSTTWGVFASEPPLPTGLMAPAPRVGRSSSGWSWVPHCWWRMGQDASWDPSQISLSLLGFPPPPLSVSQKGAQKKKLKKGAQVSRLLSKSITQSLKLSILPLVEAITFSQAVTV